MPRTQREQLVERAVSVGAKMVARTVCKQAGRQMGKLACRAASPWLLVADAAQLLAETAANHAGCEGDTSERVGQGTGLLAAIGIGAAIGSCGGPVGMAVLAGVGAAYWAGGEIVGKIISGLFSR